MARTPSRIRWVPLLVGGVVALCGVAIAVAILLPPPTVETPPSSLPPPLAPPAPTAPTVRPLSKMPTPPPAPPPPPVAAGFDWSSVPIEAPARGRDRLRAMVRPSNQALLHCTEHWQSPPGARPATVEVTLGLLSTINGLQVANVEITGGTLSDPAVQACVSEALLSSRVPATKVPVGTRRRITQRILVPVPPPPEER